MYYGMHFHEGAVTVFEGSQIMEKLGRHEVVVEITEGYWKPDLQYPTRIVQKTKTGSKQLIGEAQAIGVIPARISHLCLFENFPIMETVRKAGYQSIDELKEGLFNLYRPKPRIDWFSVMFFISVDIAIPPVTPDSHYHIEEPVSIDRNYFEKVGSGKIIISIEEGYRIFNLNRSYEIRSYDGKLLGYGEVTPFPTRISYLHYMVDLLPIEHMLKAATGRGSIQHLARLLLHRYPDKRDRDWITIEVVYVLEKSKFL